MLEMRQTGVATKKVCTVYLLCLRELATSIHMAIGNLPVTQQQALPLNHGSMLVLVDRRLLPPSGAVAQHK